MRRIAAGALTGVLATMLAFAPAAAQSYHQGFWIGAGLGSARSDLSCNVCVDDTKGVLSGFLRAGFTLRPNLLLGAEATLTRNSEDGVTERATGIAAMGYLYPWRNGLYLKGGLGIMQYNAHDDDDEFTTQAVAIHFGLGYEIRVASNVSVAPFANFIATTNGDLDFNGSKVTGDARVTLLHLGIGVTMH